MPKRSLKRFHTSGRRPFPRAVLTLCFLSRFSPVVGSITGGAERRYRQVSPTYWIMVASYFLTSFQKLLVENLRLRAR